MTFIVDVDYTFALRKITSVNYMEFETCDLNILPIVTGFALQKIEADYPKKSGRALGFITATSDLLEASEPF